MHVIDRLTTLDVKALTAIEHNAQRWISAGTETQKVAAESVLLAIDRERRRRLDEADERRRQLTVEVAEKVRDKGLFDRVLLAFSEMPPTALDVEVLREIAARPGRDFNVLARAIGHRDGGSINLVVGKLCSARERYLGAALPAATRKGENSYSALLIDFTRHGEPDGTEWHGWTLKPEAHAALRQLGIVG